MENLRRQGDQDMGGRCGRQKYGMIEENRGWRQENERRRSRDGIDGINDLDYSMGRRTL